MKSLKHKLYIYNRYRNPIRGHTLWKYKTNPLSYALTIKSALGNVLLKDTIKELYSGGALVGS
jgi:hypothetical protein